MPEKVGFSRLKLVRREDMPAPPVEPALYVELGVASPFSFLRGASDAIELALRALELGMDSIGIADRNTLAGVVRMHSACMTAGLRPLIGCRLDLTDAPSLLAYPVDREGYGRLSRLLSLGKMRAEKGECELSLQDVAAHSGGIAFIAWPGDDLDAFEADLPRLRGALTSLSHVAASWLYRGGDNARIERLDRLAKSQGCTILATNDVHYHAPDRRPLQDVVTCIREKVTIATAGYLLNPNAERHLKSPAEMARLFKTLAPCDRRDARVRRCAEFQPRRAALRISEGDRARRPVAAAISGSPDLDRRGRALARRNRSQGSCPVEARAGADRTP
jgi:error-prone DNA polymerase